MSDKFIIKHYADDPHPTLKGNGFDGLVIGDYREEAEGFITYINNRIEQLQEQVEDLTSENNRLERAWLAINKRCHGYEIELGIRKPDAALQDDK